MAKRGRKTTLTKSVLERIQPFCGSGLTEKTMMQRAGVPEGTWNRWKAKASTTKTGIYREFRELLAKDEADVEDRVLAPWMLEVDKGNIKAIELALKRNPKLRGKFKEEPTEIKQENTGGPDTINDRINEYYAELERRGIPGGFKRPTKPLESQVGTLRSDGVKESVYPSGTDDETDRAANE
jgi:hypothetical protein